MGRYFNSEGDCESDKEMGLHVGVMLLLSGIYVEYDANTNKNDHDSNNNNASSLSSSLVA